MNELLQRIFDTCNIGFSEAAQDTFPIVRDGWRRNDVYLSPEATNTLQTITVAFDDRHLENFKDAPYPIRCRPNGLSKTGCAARYFAIVTCPINEHPFDDVFTWAAGRGVYAGLSVNNRPLLRRLMDELKLATP